MFCLDGMCYALATGWLLILVILISAALGWFLGGLLSVWCRS